MHRPIEPTILYFGTPVVLVSTVNEDGTPNLAPMSSAWWLGNQCVLGFDPTSKSPENLLRTGECVLNLPSEDQVGLVDRLALTTGTDPLPAHKAGRGYRTVRDKFGCAGATPDPGERVRAMRVRECPVQLEAVLSEVLREGSRGGPRPGPTVLAVRIVRVHVEDELRMAGAPNRVDPDAWRPLIMSFQQFYGLGGRLHPSRLGTIPEESYRPAPRPPAAG